MKYMAIIDADEKPVSCEFIGCNGNVAPYLIGATTNIKPLEQQPRWVPVSERLPEDRELVLFSTKTDRVFEGRYFDDTTDRQWYSFRDDTFAWNNVVTAWMPLPPSYQGYKESE